MRSDELIKRYTQGFEFFTGEPSAMLLHPRAMEKIAGSRYTPQRLLDFIDGVRPRDDGRYVLLIALGAGEWFGANRNSDYFNEWSLKGDPAPDDVMALVRRQNLPVPPEYGYTTFERYAYPFRGHCFPAGSPVLMADRTRLPIEKVKRGDLVETMEGPRQVTRLYKRPYKGRGVRLGLHGREDDLIATEEHHVLVFRRSVIHCEHGYNRLGKNERHVKDCVEFRKSITRPEWLPISEVLPGDYLVFPKPRLGAVTPQKALAELVGWVASDGHVQRNGAISFTFSSKNKKDIAAVTRCLKACNCTSHVYPRPQYGVVSVTGASASVAEFLLGHVAGVESDKKLTARTLNWNAEAVLKLLGSYVDGDGYVCDEGPGRGRLKIRSSSRSMRHSLMDLIHAVGVPCTSNEDCPEGKLFKSPTNGKIYVSNASGCVNVSSTFSSEVAKYSRKLYTRSCRTRIARLLHDNLYLVQVTDRTDIDMNETVYNLEVEKAHHYVVADVVVHNCNSDPIYAIGERVCCAAYNDKMHRVELIVFIYTHKAPDVVEALDAGKPIAFSMGSRLLWDLCSICGHASRSRSEYCDCLKNKAGQVLPDGRKVFSYNYFPRFFDISEIVVPADRSAYSLKKVAGLGNTEIVVPEDNGILVGMDKVAGFEGLVGFLNSGGKVAEIDKKIPPEAEAVNLGPAPIEPHIWKELRRRVMDDAEFSEALPSGVLNDLKESPLDKILAALTSLGIMLKPEELDTLAGGRELPEKLDLSEPDGSILHKVKDFIGSRSLLDPIFGERTGHRGDNPRVAVIIRVRRSPVFEKYKGLLRNGTDIDQLREVTSRPPVNALLQPGLLERKILGLEGKKRDPAKAVLPFLAAAADEIE